MKKNIIYVVVGVIVLAMIVWAVSLRPTTPPQVENNLNNLTPEVSEINNEDSITTILDDGLYQIVPADSQVIWEGSRSLIANYKNRGTLEISSGNFTLNNQQIVAGSLVFSMDSLAVTEMTSVGANDQLARHLKSDDFFAVETYPEATLNIIQGIPNIDDQGGQLYEITADLTIKEITQTINFPAMIYQLNGRAVVEGVVQLDRTLWDIRFGSDKFFDNLADNVIDDNFLVIFRAVAQAND